MTGRKKLAIFAGVVFVTNLPIAWSLLITGHGRAAVIVVDIGTLIIWTIALILR